MLSSKRFLCLGRSAGGVEVSGIELVVERSISHVEDLLINRSRQTRTIDDENIKDDEEEEEQRVIRIRLDRMKRKKGVLMMRMI